MTSLDDRIAALLDAAEAELAGTPAAAELAVVRARLNQPLRVAICGRLKAGKSTLLNALVGERLAATDAGEMTRVVTSFEYDDSYSVRALDGTGTERTLTFTRVADRLVIDDAAASQAVGLRVGWPSSRLREMTLLDTPGIGSLDVEIAERATEALHPGGDPALPAADAVVYLMRHVHQTDVDFLEAFLDEAGTASPINSVAVISRADEVGGARVDAMTAAGRVAARYASDERVRSLASAVVPVSGLIAETAATLQEREASALRTLRAEDEAVVDRMLLSVDLWREAGVGPLSVEIRQELLDRFGMFGLRLGVSWLREGRWSNATELARLLNDASGLPALRTLLRERFAGRARALIGRSVLDGLGALARRSANDDVATRIDARIEELRASAHEFAELRLMDMVWSGVVGFRPAEIAEAERVTGAGQPWERLGVPNDAPVEELRKAAIDGATRWRTAAGDAMAEPVVATARETMARSYEGLFASLSPAKI